MMNLTYENQGGSTFLVCAIEEGEQLDSMSAGMLNHNDIPGLVKAEFTQTGANRSVRYNVSSKIPVKQYFSGPVNKKRLLGVCLGIVDAILSAEEYMIGPDMLVIDTEYMFTDAAAGETALICLPVIREDPQVDLCAFFKRVMFSAQYDQTEDRGYTAKIINYLNGAAAFSPERFKELLTELSSADKSAPVGPGNAEYPPVPPAAAAPKTPWAAPVAPMASVPPAGPAAPMAFVPPTGPLMPEAPVPPTGPLTPEAPVPPTGPVAPMASVPPTGPVAPMASVPPTGPAAPMASVPPTGPVAPAAPVSPPPGQGFSAFPMGGRQTQTPGGFSGAASFPQDSQWDSSTVILDRESSSRQITPHLFRTRNSEKIPISKPIFRLGRDIESNDYAITDNIYVGHSHCHIVSRDGEYFVVDDNSKNRTCVDGTAIPPGQEIKLTHGCRLRVANEDFEFRLY